MGQDLKPSSGLASQERTKENEIAVESNRIPRITPRWLQQQRNSLKSSTMLAHLREKKEREIAAAEEQDKRAKELDEQLATKGFKPNQYAGTCSVYGRAVGPMQGYVRKVNGKWVTYCLKAALEF